MKRIILASLAAAALVTAGCSATGDKQQAASQPAGSPQAAKHHSNYHGRDHAPELHQQLGFNQGKKWETDEPLRRHMWGIREALAAKRGDIVSRRMDTHEQAALGVAIEQKVIAILNDCRLESPADRQLHYVVAELVQASDTLQGKAGLSREAGAGRALHAVQMYATYFNHPGWVAVF